MAQAVDRTGAEETILFEAFTFEPDGSPMGSCSVATRRKYVWRLAIALAATLVATTTFQGCPNDCPGVASAKHIVSVDIDGLGSGEAFSLTRSGHREIVCPGHDDPWERCDGPDRVVLQLALGSRNPADVELVVVSESGKTGTATVETRDLNDECESTADPNHYEVTVVLE